MNLEHIRKQWRIGDSPDPWCKGRRLEIYSSWSGFPGGLEQPNGVLLSLVLPLCERKQLNLAISLLLDLDVSAVLQGIPRS